MNEQLRVQISNLMNSKDIDEVASGIFLIAQNDLREYQTLLWSWKDHLDENIRSAVFMALAYYWKVPEFEPLLKERIGVEENVVVKMSAISLWVKYHQQSKNYSVIRYLLEYAENLDYDILVRCEALKGIYCVLGLDEPEIKTKEYGKLNIGLLSVLEHEKDFENLFLSLIPKSYIAKITNNGV